MAFPEAPLHPLSQADEPAPLYPVPDARVNFADNPEALNYIQQNILGMVMTIRDDNAALRDEWASIRRMSLMEHDEGQNYRGMSNAYLPVYARALDVRVGHISQALFPSDDYIDAKAVDEVAFRTAPPMPGGRSQDDIVKTWMQYQFEKQMRIRVAIKPFIRQLYDFGVSVGKVWYQKDPKRKLSGRRAFLPPINGSMMSYDDVYARKCEGVRFQVRNMMTWHMWPPTVADIRQANIVFEDIQVTNQYIKEVGKSQGWKNLDLAYQGQDPSNTNADLQLQQDSVRMTPTTAFDYKGMASERGLWVYLTECYFNMPVPDNLYRPNEEKGSYVPVRVLLAGSTVLLAQRNPFWFQHAPYVIRRHNEMPDSFFGIGMGRVGRSLQMLANDFMNQTNDNGSYGLNPVILLNPNVVAGPMEPLAPGRTWHLTDLNGIKFDRPPIEQLQYGLQLTNWIVSQMNDLMGTPPILQGNSTKGAASTATGAQLLQTNTHTALQDEVEEIELDVLIPLMEMAHSLGQQYQDQDLQVATAGGIINVRPDDLVGQFAFRWLASSQAMNKQARAQQSMQLLQIISQQVPLLQMQGKGFNPIPLIERIAKEGLGIRDVDSFWTAAPAPPGMPGAEGPPGAGGMPGEETMPNTGGISAVPQAAGGGPRGGMDSAPGEGGAFGEVRDQADAISAAYGAQQG